MKWSGRRSIPVWGLRGKVRLRLDAGVRTELDDPRDADVVSGFVAGLLDMPRLDFARRFWSGRLSEFLGSLELPGTDLDAYRIDVAMRGLGFRRRTERAFRSLPAEEKLRAKAWATGINAWIDQGRLAQSPTYARLESSPRLMGAADGLLLRRAPVELASTAVPVDLPPAAAELWAALHRPELRAPGAVGEAAGPDVPLPSFALDPVSFAAPRVVPCTVLDRDDGHLFVQGEGDPRRLFVDRPDVSVRSRVRRPWVRRTPEGWLMSDALEDADGPRPPTGDGLVLAWPAAASVPSRGPLRLPPLPEASPWRVHGPRSPLRGHVELVPKRG